MFYRRTVENILTGISAAHKTLMFSTHTINIACRVTLVAVTLKCTVLLMVTVTLKCSVLLMITVTAVFSVLMITVTEVSSDSYGHCHFAMFSAPYSYSNSAVFSAPHGHCHSAPYRRSAVVMDVPNPRTASRPNDTVASHSCHFNTVLCPRSNSERQLPLNCSRHDITGAAFSVQNCCKIFAVTALLSLAPLQTCQHIYITLYNVQL